MLFQVSVMWCSKRTTDSKPSALRKALVRSSVPLSIELLQLNPISGEEPSARAKSLAPINVHRAAYGLSLPTKT